MSKRSKLKIAVLVVGGFITSMIILIAGFLVYGLITLFDPNYIEYGPRVELHRSRDCIQQAECLVHLFPVSMYKNKPTTLASAVEAVANKCDPEQGFLSCLRIGRSLKLAAYPKDADEWSCVDQEQVITDLKGTNIQEDHIYKCWPIQ